jgi:hypothetical protein
MKSQVIRSIGPGETTCREVKNLGWLFRNRRLHEVTHVKLFRWSSGNQTIIIHSNNGWSFACDFACYTVLVWWVRNRRALKGIPITVTNFLGEERIRITGTL